MLPVSIYASAHATDAAWAAYGAAKVRYNARKNESLDDETLDALCGPISDAETTILATPAATLTDIERKLAVVSGWNGDNDIPAELVDDILADVRRLNGTRMAV